MRLHPYSLEDDQHISLLGQEHTNSILAVYNFALNERKELKLKVLTDSGIVF